MHASAAAVLARRTDSHISDQNACGASFYGMEHGNSDAKYRIQFGGERERESEIKITTLKLTRMEIHVILEFRTLCGLRSLCRHCSTAPFRNRHFDYIVLAIHTYIHSLTWLWRVPVLCSARKQRIYGPTRK